MRFLKQYNRDTDLDGWLNPVFLYMNNLHIEFGQFKASVFWLVKYYTNVLIAALL